MNNPLARRGFAGRRRQIAGRLLSTLALVAVGTLMSVLPAAAAPRQPQATCHMAGGFLHTATAANSFFDYSNLDDPSTNGCPGELVYVTATFTPGEVYDNHALGVWYDGQAQKWAIFHEDDLTDVPLGATYEITTFPFSNAAHFIQTATTANSANDWTEIDNPVTNNQPTYQLIVTPNWSVGNVYDNHALGVWYNTVDQKWAIFHEDRTPIPAGASFNVVVATLAYGHSYLQRATADNSFGDWTVIDYPDINNNPSAGVYVTASFNGLVYDPHVLGVWYDGNAWTIFHQDNTPIPVGATYNVYTTS